MSLKQDRTGTRTSEDLRRRINLKQIDETTDKANDTEKIVGDLNIRVNAMSNSLDNTRKNYVSTQIQTFTEEQKTRARNNIGAGTSSFSGSYNNLSDKPTSLSKINPTEGNKLTGIETGAQKNKIETIKVNGVEQPITDKSVDILPTNSYDLSSYADPNVTILRVSCIEKNKRVCVNFVGTAPLAANNTTTLFTFPTALRPTATKDFVVFGQSSNDDGNIGYGYLTDTGILQVRFSTGIASYVRFSFTYDLD